MQKKFFIILIVPLILSASEEESNFCSGQKRLYSVVESSTADDQKGSGYLGVRVFPQGQFCFSKKMNLTLKELGALWAEAEKQSRLIFNKPYSYGFWILWNLKEKKVKTVQIVRPDTTKLQYIKEAAKKRKEVLEDSLLERFNGCLLEQGRERIEQQFLEGDGYSADTESDNDNEAKDELLNGESLRVSLELLKINEPDVPYFVKRQKKK